MQAYGAAVVESVDPESPADDAGFTPGCQVIAVDGHPLRDVIDWRWYTDGYEIDVTYIDTDGDEGTVVLEREDGEQWGFNFTKAIFDDLILCRNACTFCFMRQLPDDARDSLTLRDDDYRLSFLQGTFVTFTNLSDDDKDRIVEQHISPLRWSMHCVTPELRRRVIGRHAQHGIDAAEYLLAHGIELHAQIVLMPGVNDGDELRRTLEWAWGHPGILSVGIVPLGYTKHQTTFEHSFNAPEQSQAVIDCIEPFQKRAMQERDNAWVFASDEFYRNAYPRDLLDHLPPTEFYGDFELFEDGIGIVRSFVDDWESCRDDQPAAARALEARDARVMLVAGCAQKEFLTPLIEASPLAGRVVPLYVKNDYFGGNVDVTGLLCACDMAPAVRTEAERGAAAGRPYAFAAVPEVVFNADGVTLDGATFDEMEAQAGFPMHVVSCDASSYLPQIVAHCRDLRSGAQ